MEEQFKDLDTFTSKWVQEAGVQKPSASFMDTIMQSIEAQSKPIVYAPLISKKIWVFLGICAVCCLLYVYWLPVSQTGLANIDLIREKLAFQNPIADFKFSKVSAYALGFLALFLIQIPFLKRMISRRY